MRNLKLIYIMIASTLVFQGCAHSALDAKVDQEMAQETTVKTNADLRAESSQLLQTAPGLTSDQRARLVALRDATRSQLDSLWSQSLKLRAVLIKDLITAKYNEEEVDLIKDRMKKIEDQRLAVTFNAVEQANTILVHEPALPNHQELMNEFFFEGSGHGGRD